MKFVRNLENFFEKYIEGYFNKKFYSELQPVEIAKSMIREMESKRSVGVSHVYVPNAYTIHFNNEDYERLNPYAQAFCAEWAAYVQKEAANKKYTILGKPLIEIVNDQSVGKGKYHITSTFTQPLPVDNEPGDNANDEDAFNTRVFNKLDVPVMSQNGLCGIFTVVEGLDTGKKVDFFASRVNIGRRESNELPLTDMNTSRLHAYVVYEEGSHVIYDAKSLNGTYVNDRRITRRCLQAGDRIKVGNTILLYEVE